jgi:hypothetical protein
VPIAAAPRKPLPQNILNQNEASLWAKAQKDFFSGNGKFLFSPLDLSRSSQRDEKNADAGKSHAGPTAPA